MNVSSCRKGESVEIISDNVCMKRLVERLVQCDDLLFDNCRGDSVFCPMK